MAHVSEVGYPNHYFEVQLSLQMDTHGPIHSIYMYKSAWVGISNIPKSNITLVPLEQKDPPDPPFRSLQWSSEAKEVVPLGRYDIFIIVPLTTDYRYITNRNHSGHSEIGVIFTNLAVEVG